MNRLTIFACESQPIVLEGLAKVLSNCDDLEYIGAASSLNDALEWLRDRHPDVILVDQSPGLKVVFQFISDVRSTWARCQPVLWVNDLAEIDCFRALQLGARGILKKTLPVESVLECLRSVARGNVWIESSLSDHVMGSIDRRSAPRLTPREKEIVHHVCGGPEEQGNRRGAGDHRGDREGPPDAHFRKDRRQGPIRAGRARPPLVGRRAR